LAKTVTHTAVKKAVNLKQQKNGVYQQQKVSTFIASHSEPAV